MNPFPGLRPFEADEEHLFFGREAQVDELLARLRQKRFVAVVGASGSGKSSLVRAGLLPALYGGFMSATGSRWHVAIMHPGRTPIAALARALDASGVTQNDGDPILRIGLLQATLERGALGLVEVVAEARLASEASLLVLVDQFEELVRFQSLDAVAFVKLLVTAVTQSTYPIYVVITMRSDFLGDVSHFRQLPELVSESLFLVPRLTRAQFGRAIEGPIRVAGGTIAPRLTNRLLNDLEDDEDQLPVLQHALMRTWDAHAAGDAAAAPLDIVDLEAIGTLSEALSRHADEVYASLRSDRLRAVAERVFKALTDLGDDNRGVRRPTRFAQLCAIVNASPEEVREVVDAFRASGCCFLSPPSTRAVDGDTVIDVTHESLMRIWNRLQRWVREEAVSAQIYRRLAAAAQLHREGKSALWRDPDLAIATAWRAENAPTAAWGERISSGFGSAMEFLNASGAEHARERRLRALRVRGSLLALVLIAAALAGISLVAFSQWRIADASLRVERAEDLADASLQDSSQPGVAAAMAADAYEMSKTPRTVGAMLAQLERLRGLRAVAIPALRAVAFAQRGTIIGALTEPSPAPARLLVFDSFDLGSLASVAVPALGSVQRLCGAADAAEFVLSDGRRSARYDAASGWTFGPSQRSAQTTQCSADPSSGAGVRTYDPNTRVYLAYDGHELVEQAAEGISAPGVGMQAAPVWPGSFATSGSTLITAGAGALASIDLNRYRGQAAVRESPSKNVRLSDPGDGLHALAFDYRDGNVRVLTTAPRLVVEASLSVHAPSFQNGAYDDQPQVAYDPLAKSVTEVWSGGVARYALNGGIVSTSPWTNLALTASIADWGPAIPYVISPHGSYVGLVWTPAEGDASAPFYSTAIVPSAGGPAFRFASTPFFSTNEGSAIGALYGEDTSELGIYRLPYFNRRADVDLPLSKMAALAPNGATVAYALDGPSSNGSDVQLFDVATNSRIEPAIPGPPGGSVTSLEFSDDGRYLIATYRRPHAPPVLAVYSIDPREWQRSLCLWAGARAAKAAEIALARGIAAPDACARYVAAR